jgi:ATP-dependent helicase HepA
MSANDLLNDFKQRGCLPHQAEFAANFLAPESARKHLLASAPGLGKGFATAAVVSHAFASRQASRILVLCPSALVAQWHEAIWHGNPDIPVLAVDRRKFRELEAGRTEADSPWPASSVVVLSIDLAKQADVLNSLASVTWDLLVVDEVQSVKATNNRYKLIADLLNRSPAMRVLFLRSAGSIDGSEIDPTSDPLLSGATVTVWSRTTVRGHDGKPLLPEVRFEWITHRRKADEIAVLSKLQESVQAMAGANPATQLILTTLLQSASSSLFALEQRLSRICQWRNDAVHAIASADESYPDLEDAGLSAADAGDLDEQSEMRQELAEMASQLLPMLDSVNSDSKLEVLLGVLETLGLKAGGGRRLCVFTRYVDTATYLETALREHHSGVAKSVGALSSLEREHIREEFARNGGILILTESTSFTIPEVTAVVFYDLPLNPSVLDERIGQFVRVGRQGPVRFFAFTDESNALVIERLQRKIAEVKKLLGDQELRELLFSKDKT